MSAGMAFGIFSSMVREAMAGKNKGIPPRLLDAAMKIKKQTDPSSRLQSTLSGQYDPNRSAMLRGGPRAGSNPSDRYGGGKQKTGYRTRHIVRGAYGRTKGKTQYAGYNREGPHQSRGRQIASVTTETEEGAMPTTKAIRGGLRAKQDLRGGLFKAKGVRSRARRKARPTAGLSPL